MIRRKAGMFQTKDSTKNVQVRSLFWENLKILSTTLIFFGLQGLFNFESSAHSSLHRQIDTINHHLQENPKDAGLIFRRGT